MSKDLVDYYKNKLTIAYMIDDVHKSGFVNYVEVFEHYQDAKKRKQELNDKGVKVIEFVNHKDIENEKFTKVWLELNKDSVMPTTVYN
tara:strand:- start:243 stop:506 length:264 start_codon:yes stop_codon:yes gene_type:complete